MGLFEWNLKNRLEVYCTCRPARYPESIIEKKKVYYCLKCGKKIKKI